LLTKHDHASGTFDPGHCWDCARLAGLVDHYQYVQREERLLREARGWGREARLYAIFALCSSGIAILLAAIVLVTG
jgi:hypothetical protein